jgi:sugar phosphate permease
VTLVPLILVTSWEWAFYSVGILGLILLVPIYLYVQDTPKGNTLQNREPLKLTLTNQGRSIRDSLKIKGIMVLSISDIATNLAWWGVSLWLPTYLVQAQGISHSELAFVASIPYVGGVVGVYIGSWISRRTGRIVSTAAVFSVLCAVFIILLIGATGLATIIAVMFLIFFFISILQPNLFTLLQGVCPPRLIGSATGWMNGIAVGVGALGPVIIGTSVSITGAFSSGLIILAGLQVFAGLILLLFKDKRAAGPTKHAALSSE